MNKRKKVRRKGTISKKTIKEIRDLRLKGFKQDSVAKKLGVSNATVTKYQFDKSMGAYGNK